MSQSDSNGKCCTRCVFFIRTGQHSFDLSMPMTNLDSILKSRDMFQPPIKINKFMFKKNKKQRQYFSNKGLVKAMVFPVGMYGCELDHKESSVLKNWCFWTALLEKTLESPLDYKEIKPVHPKGNQSQIFMGRTDAEAETNTLAIWCEELTHWKRPWFWERLKAGGEGDDRGWDGWMASLTLWRWVWARSGSWWWTGKPHMLQPMGSQRFGHD